MRTFFLHADRFFLAAALLSGLVFVFVTPPFQVPDEPMHFYRAYAVSEGNLVPARRDGRSGEMLPASLRRLVGDLSRLVAERKLAPRDVLRASRVELESERREFLDFPTTYTAAPFLPQATGIALGRLFGAPPLVLLYLARLLNLVAGTALILISLRQLPAYRWLAALIALTPMAGYLRASASADALTVAAAFLLAATVARLAFGAGETVGRRDLALLAFAAAALCLSKPAYFPLALTPLLIPANRLPRGRRAPAVGLVAAVLVGAFAFTALNAWPVEVSRSMRPQAGIDPGAQVHSAVVEPWRFLRIVAADYFHNSPRYLAEFVGRLGWLDTALPAFLIASYLAVLAALLVVDARASVVVEPWQRAALALVTLSTLVLISASQYAVWTPYRAGHIEGIQGRYFHPAAPAAVWTCHVRRWAGVVRPKYVGLLVVSVWTLSFAVTLAVLIRRYYG